VEVFEVGEKVRAIYLGIEYDATIESQIETGSYQVHFESDEGAWGRATKREHIRRVEDQNQSTRDATVIPDMTSMAHHLLHAARSPRLSMLCFMVLTLVQIVVFICEPRLVYGKAAVLLDKPPEFVFFRLIGVKEVGLMCMYAAAVPLYSGNIDSFFVSLTAWGRLSTLIFMSWIVLGLGGPVEAYLGIIQDVLFGSWALYASITVSASTPSNTTKQQNLPLIVCVAVCGCVEAWHGISVMQSPREAALAGFGELTDMTLSVAPLHLGYRSLGYMTALCGLYQLAVAAGALFGSTALSWRMAFAIMCHHLSDHILLGLLGVWIRGCGGGQPIATPVFHLQCGLTLAAVLVTRRKG
jgi:hypothetical protein